MPFLSFKVRPFVYVASIISLFSSVLFMGCGGGLTMVPFGQPLLGVLPVILVIVGVIFCVVRILAYALTLGLAYINDICWH